MIYGLELTMQHKGVLSWIMTKPLSICFLLCFLLSDAVSSNHQQDVSNGEALKLLDSLLRKYDRRSTPTDNMGIATNVSLELYVASLGSINTENMDYVTDTYLRQQWRDPRLAHKNWTSPMDLSDPKLVKAIWKPEVFFPNAKEANFQFVTVPNVLIRIHPNGDILYILRLRIKFSCMMELSRYPLDSQICGMQIASFSKTTRELQLFWSIAHKPVTIAADLRMPQFTIERVTPTICNEQFHLGNYSCLVAEFYMKRSVSFHLIQSYLPSILIVAVSWVSFWMDIESVPGRISLGVITLLAVSSQAGLDKNVPQTSYVKAIDVWMGLCTGFVFAALVEFTIVNFWFRKRQTAGHCRLGTTTCGVENGGTAMTEAVEVEPWSDRCPCKQCGQQFRSSNHRHNKNLPSPTTVSLRPDGRSTKTDIFGQHEAGDHHQHLLHYHHHHLHHQQKGDEQTDRKTGISRCPAGCGIRSSRSHPAECVDQACRLIFPLGFGICNVFYWLYYLYLPDQRLLQT